jgi:hypothetical protein
MGSRNGTRHNGTALGSQSAEIRDGDLLEAAGMLFVASLPDAPEESP